MADVNQNLSPGDPLPTSVKVWNPILEAARKATQGDAGSPSPANGSGHDVEVRIKNTESTTLPRFAPIGIADDAVLISPDAAGSGWIETPVLKGTFPKLNGNIAIALEPIKENDTGRGRLRGLFSVTIDVQSESHTFAEPKEGEFEFISVASGRFPIIWKESGTGEKKGYVQIGSDPDTTHRQTAKINETYDDAIPGTPVSLMVHHHGWDNDRGIVAAIPVEDSLTLNLNTGDYADNKRAIQQGTVGFLTQKKKDGNGIPLKTANGGYIEAIVYQLHSRHEYAVLDGKPINNNGNNGKCLISVPHGPYRILAKQILPGQPTTYPHYVKALLREGVTPHDVTIQPTSGAFLFGDSNTIRFTVGGGWRFGFPELPGLSRNWFVDGAPKPVYAVSFHCDGLVIRGTSGKTSFDVDISGGGGVRTIHQYPGVQARLRAIGELNSGATEEIHAFDVNIEPKVGTSSSSSPVDPNQNLSLNMGVIFEEKYKQLYFELTNVAGYIISPVYLIGHAVIHRLGDRGAPLGEAMQSYGLTVTPLDPGDPGDP